MEIIISDAVTKFKISKAFNNRSKINPEEIKTAYKRFKKILMVKVKLKRSGMKKEIN